MKIQVFDRRAITVASLSVLLVVGCVGAAFTWLYSRVVSVIDQDSVAGIQRDLMVTAAIYRDSGREGVIKAHGGRMWAEHNTPRGVAFMFSLPIDRPQPVVPVESTEDAA